MIIEMMMKEKIMEITTEWNEEEKTATFRIAGRINASTAQQFESTLTPYYSTCRKMVLDFTNVEFISSAGLRVLMDSDEAMKKHGSMSIRNINDGVREVLNMTGFIDFLTVE